MGWTEYNANNYNSKGNVDVIAEVNSLLNWEDGYHKCEVLKSSRVGNVVYSAVKRTVKDSGNEIVFATIFLVSVRNKDYYNFAYKDMDETCGPYYYDCPKAILDMLTPTESEWANNWRNKCRETLKEKAERKKNGTALDKLPERTKIKIMWGGEPVILIKRMRGWSTRKRENYRWYDYDGYYYPKSKIERCGYEVITE